MCRSRTCEQRSVYGENGVHGRVIVQDDVVVVDVAVDDAVGVVDVAVNDAVGIVVMDDVVSVIGGVVVDDDVIGDVVVDGAAAVLDDVVNDVDKICGRRRRMNKAGI